MSYSPNMMAELYLKWGCSWLFRGIFQRDNRLSTYAHIADSFSYNESHPVRRGGTKLFLTLMKWPPVWPWERVRPASTHCLRLLWVSELPWNSSWRAKAETAITNASCYTWVNAWHHVERSVQNLNDNDDLDLFGWLGPGPWRAWLRSTSQVGFILLLRSYW